VDSYFNGLSGKYLLIRPPSAAKARVRTIDVRVSKMVRPGISKPLFEASRSSLRAGKKVLFLINRKGHSTLLLCRECGHREVCPECRVPLVLHSGDRTLRCHYCGFSRKVPRLCSRCRSAALELLGMGTQRLQEEVQTLLGISAVRLDSDSACRASELAGILEDIAGGEPRVIVGTKMVTKKIAADNSISLAALLNVDAELGFPDFRASEKVFAELSALRELIEPKGEMLIQTRFPAISLFRHLKSGDYAAFVREELTMRKELRYPPYCRLLNMRFRGETNPLGPMLSSLAEELRGKDIEILGPTAVKGREGGEELSLLLKSSGRSPLREAAQLIMKECGNLKGVGITVDVDPL
jgi:primosomal protein N' (replication factor Y)